MFTTQNSILIKRVKGSMSNTLNKVKLITGGEGKESFNSITSRWHM